MNNPRKRMPSRVDEQPGASSRECVVKVEAEFLEIRDGILASVSAGESKELYFKVKGVCHRCTERGRRGRLRGAW